jgi:tristetraprolin
LKKIIKERLIKMSTAVMHTPSFYEFDLFVKNQAATRNLTHLTSSGNTSSTVANSNNNNNNHNSTAVTLSALSAASQLNNNLLNSHNSNVTSASTAAAAALALQQQLNAAVAAQQAQVNQQHQQQQQQKLLIHNALQRAVSQPHAAATAMSLVNSLIENFGHRKLERTQSEPLPQVNTSRYKTELCRPFEEAGECKYGDKCQFAHGMHELRSLQRHPKYKTELCRTFHSVGFCPYGPRCHFVHNAEEARLHNRAVNAAYARMAAEAAGNGNSLPLTPPLSMSTGSDRASPTGSLSLSPTNSMASFFPDQNSPTFPQGFSYPQSPPSSPPGMSPPATPPPPPSSTSSSSSSQLDEARLPVFNRLSSTIDAFTNMALN